LEHLIETSPLPDPEAVSLDELMGKLSFGWALPDEFLLIARQIWTISEFLEKAG